MLGFPVRALSLLLAASFAGATATAQCANDWLPGNPFTGLWGEVRASVMHDPDGAGPLPQRLVVGGDLLWAGNSQAYGVAAWDPVTQSWSGVGTGPGSEVNALAVLPNNDLVAAGSLSLAPFWSGTVAARWNGASWSPMVGAHPVQGLARCVLVLPNGDVVVGGDMVSWNGVDWIGAHVARWDGSDWSTMQPPSYATIDALALLPNGHLLAAGQGLDWPNGDIAQWDGTSWSSFAAPMEYVRSLTVLANGDVAACGALVGSRLGVHRWNGSAWSTLGLIGEVRTIRELPNGDLLAGGTLSLPGVDAPSLAHWNGSVWQQVGSSHGYVATLTAMSSGGWFAGGSWIETAGGDATSAAEVVGTTWSSLGGANTNGDVTLALDLSDGDLVVAGTFTRIGGVTAPGLARWNGSAWAPISGAIDGTIFDMVEMPNGDLVACGEFLSAGGVPVTNIARWNGASWTSMGWTDPLAGFAPSGAIRTLTVMPNGDLMIGGAFTTLSGLGAPRFVARYDGATWSAVGLATSGVVRDMVVLPNGDLVVCGDFGQVEEPWLHLGTGVQALRVARWDGTHWGPMGTGMNARVDHVFLDANGELVATGPFTLADNNVANGIARWNGTTWYGVGAVAGAPATRMAAALPDGNLVRWAPTLSSSDLERWDGISWMPLTAAVTPKCLVMRRNGDLFVGGTQFVNGAWSMGHARFATNCPASATVFGGCPSSGGANALTAETLPYSGGMLRSRATGLPMTSIAIVATGFLALPSPVALATFLPNAGPGCTLAIAPDILQAQSTLNATVRSSLPIPSAPSIVGQSFYQQMIVLEIDPTLGVVESTSTNTLQLTVGVF